MTRLLLQCLLAAGFLGFARADDAPGFARQVATCAVISALEDRLGCYDMLARRAGLDEARLPPGQAEHTGKWQVAVSENPLDDTIQVVISLVADSGGSSFGGNIVFIARCIANTTDVYIVWNEYLGRDLIDMSDNYKYLTLRVGRDPARTEKWRLFPDAMTTAIAEAPETLLKEMARERRFIAQVTPFWGGQTPPFGTRPVTAIFDTTGMAGALTPLAQACLWSAR